MIRSLNTAEQAMTLSQLRIEALANNLANVDSTGFKQILLRVAEQGTTETATGAKEPAPQDAGAAKSQSVGRGNWSPVKDLTMYHALDVRKGPIRATGRDTDLALMERGFFVIQTADGERYTRNGSFRIDAAGQLTTAEGNLVLGDGGAIQLRGTSFNIQADGQVILDGNPAGRLKVVDFEDPTRLENLGGSLLVNPEDMPARAVPQSEIILAQGHLEGSNVNPVDTLVAMITAQRAFEMQSQVMTTEDEMLGKAVNNLPHVG